MNIPSLSPYGLIQESLWPDEWKCLVACQMLNRTSKKQVEKVLSRFFTSWPNPADFLQADPAEVSSMIATLGFKNRRTKNLFDMTRKYCTGNWRHASELPGIGVYASRAWEIFFKDELGDDPPEDHALVLYWRWRKANASRTKI